MRNKINTDCGIDILDGMDSTEPTSLQNARRWIGMSVLALTTVGTVSGSTIAVYAMYENTPQLSNDISNYIVRNSNSPSAYPASPPESSTPDITDSPSPREPSTTVP